jgi:hypothetical protein
MIMTAPRGQPSIQHLIADVLMELLFHGGLSHVINLENEVLFHPDKTS